MNLTELKTIYSKANNINFLNLINKIEEINIRTNISISKIILYLASICTSKIDKKNLNILLQHFGTNEMPSEYEINLILNKNISNNEILTIENIQEKQINKKPKKTKSKKLINNDINSKQEL